MGAYDRAMLERVLQKVGRVMALLDGIQAEVTRAGQVMAAASAKLDALLVNAGDPAQVAALAAELKTANDSLQAKLDSLAPPAPPAA